MISLGEAVRMFGVPIANHLWQSTVFGLIAACSTLMLRRNEARLRFWIWFGASLKFLLPFGPLVSLGTIVAKHVGGLRTRTFASAVEITNQPLVSSPFNSVLAPTKWDHFHSIGPLLLVMVWLLGSFSVLLVWVRRWRQVSKVKRAAIPLTVGREAALLNSLNPLAGGLVLPILLSKDPIEPGIFGIWKPVLLWPAHISNELSEPQLSAILAHEMWHVRRQDNLTAAVQMLIEAFFWFHPLVWWFGSRQMEERERACDEGVLGLGSTPAVYAESILKTCKFCVEAPLPCVAGVNGSNLKKRIIRIMQMRNVTVLSRTKKLLLGTLTATTLIVPFAFGVVSISPLAAQTNASQQAPGPLRIIAVKRNTSGSPMTKVTHVGDETTITNTTAKNLIQMAYSLKDYQLTGGPSWLDKERFDLTLSGDSTGGTDHLVSNAAIKEILSQDFHLVLKQETKPGPIYALVVGGGGARFSPTTPANAPGTNEPLLSMRVMQKDGQGQITITGGPAGLADALSAQVGRPIVDKTGLSGLYSIDFHWATASASPESIAADLQQQLGLTLTPEEGPVVASVVDSITMPTGA